MTSSFASGRSVGDAVDLFVIADPLDNLDPRLDTTLGLIGAARRRGHRVLAGTVGDLVLRGNRCQSRLRDLDRRGATSAWVDLDDAEVVLFRTDPPVDPAYLAATYLLDFVDTTSTIMVNDPRGIRHANEKLFCHRYPDLCPPTLVTSDTELIRDFVGEQQRAIVKPVDGHAGRGVLRLDDGDPNRDAIIEIATDRGARAVVVQRWLDESTNGNKRLFVHAGQPVAAALRCPQDPDFRIGLPVHMVPVTDHDRHLCSRLAPDLRTLGLVLVGLDLIDDHLIDANVTSPGALGKCDALLGTSLCDDFIDLLEHLPPDWSLT